MQDKSPPSQESELSTKTLIYAIDDIDPDCLWWIKEKTSELVIVYAMKRELKQSRFEQFKRNWKKWMVQKSYGQVSQC